MADSRVRGRPAAKTRPQFRAGAAVRLLEFYFSVQITAEPRRTAASTRGGVCTPGSSSFGLSPTNMFGAMQETQETEVRSLGQEDPLEEEMATHSAILAWRISWTEKPGGLQSRGSQRVKHD